MSTLIEQATKRLKIDLEDGSSRLKEGFIRKEQIRASRWVRPALEASELQHFAEVPELYLASVWLSLLHLGYFTRLEKEYSRLLPLLIEEGVVKEVPLPLLSTIAPGTKPMDAIVGTLLAKGDPLWSIVEPWFSDDLFFELRDDDPGGKLAQLLTTPLVLSHWDLPGLNLGVRGKVELSLHGLTRELTQEDLLFFHLIQLGTITNMYVALFSLNMRLPLITCDQDKYKTMVRFLQHLANGISPEPAAQDYSAAFRMFDGTLSFLLPSFSPRTPETILELRRQLNRHGELDEFRSFLRADAVARSVATEDPESIRQYVVGVLEPQLKLIERAIEQRWRIFGRYVYETSIKDMWKHAVEFMAAGFLWGEPLAGLVLATASAVFGAEKKTQEEIRASSPQFAQLQYLVGLRRASRTR